MTTRRAAPKHLFRFKLRNGKMLTAPAKVRQPKQPVELILKAAHVRNSMEAKGVGNTQTCSMAICALDQADAFRHEVEGYIDWQYTRAYVVSKVSSETGLPTECYVYRHQDNIAKLNDSRGGQKKLLADLEANGPRVVRLFPPRNRTGIQPKGRPEGRKDGSRNRPISAVGAKLRFAVAELGGVPA